MVSRESSAVKKARCSNNQEPTPSEAAPCVGGSRVGGEHPKRVRFADPAAIPCVEDFEFQIVEQMLVLGVVLHGAGSTQVSFEAQR